MPRLTDIVTRSLAVGALLLAVALPARAYADAPTMDANGVVTETRWGTTVTGYYDQQGFFNDGWKPYVLGFYDEHGDWHYYPNTVPLPGYFDTHGDHYQGPLPTPTYDDWRRYDYSQSNYYAGYGSRADIRRGWSRVIGTDGQPHYINLRDHRVIVHLRRDRGVTVFDAEGVEIHTGDHVTFVSEDGAYVLTQIKGDGFKEAVTITPERVFSWTYTHGGWYRVEDLTSGCSREAELDVVVHGDSVAWDDSAFDCAKFWTWRSIPWVWNPAPAAFTPIPIPEYTPQPQAPPPPPPQKVHKKVKRNSDVK